MSLEKPQILIDVARNAGKKICRIRIPQLAGIRDCGTRDLAVHRQLGRQVVQMIFAGGNAQRVILQLAALGGYRDGALGGAAQAGDALGDLIDLFQHGVGDLVEELMQGNEIRALHIPMRMFNLALQIDRVGQGVVQNHDDIAPDFLRQIDLRFVHGHPFETNTLGYFALLWRRSPRKKVMSGPVLTAASSAKPNSMRQRSLKRRTAPTVSCRLGPSNRSSLFSTRRVCPSSCARSDQAEPRARVAANRPNTEVLCAAPANISSPKGCATPSSAASCQRRQRSAPCAHAAPSQAPLPISFEADPVGAASPPQNDSVRCESSMGYHPNSPETSPMPDCGRVISMRLFPE